MKRLLLLIPVIIIIGCGLFGGPDYFPLKKGNIWKYAGMTTVETSLGVDTTSKIFHTSEITADDQKIGGKKVFTMTTRDSILTFNPDTFYVSTNTSYLRETDNAILTYSSLLDNDPDTTLMTDLKENKTWRQIIGSDTVVYTVLNKEDVTVPAKTYKNAWKIKAVWNSGTPLYYWYADGTGLIKYYYEYSPYSTVTIRSWFELTQATIK
ncbi:MAG: hypothetical protein ABIK33_04355 [candidate division WOR-3 bacterium]